MEPITLSYGLLSALMACGVAYGLAQPTTDEEYWRWTDSLRNHLQLVDEEYLKQLEELEKSHREQNENKPEDEKEPFKIPFIPGLENLFKKMGEELSGQSANYGGYLTAQIPLFKQTTAAQVQKEFVGHLSDEDVYLLEDLPLDFRRKYIWETQGDVYMWELYITEHQSGSYQLRNLQQKRWKNGQLMTGFTSSLVHQAYVGDKRDTNFYFKVGFLNTYRNTSSGLIPIGILYYADTIKASSTDSYYLTTGAGSPAIGIYSSDLKTNPTYPYTPTVPETDPDTGEIIIPNIPEVTVPDPETFPQPLPTPDAAPEYVPGTDSLPDSPPITVTYPEPDPDPGTDPDTPGEEEPDVPNSPEFPPIIPPIDEPGGDLPGGEDGNLGENPTDNWGNQNSGGLYYYYIGTDVSDSGIDNVIGHAVGTVSLSYTPYLWYTDCNITKIPYDSERFNQPSNFTNFYVYRINNVTRPVKKVGGFTAYADNFSVDIGEGKPYSYKNETKLYQYPYSFAYVYDGINHPLEIKYHYLSYVYNDIYIKQTVSDKCTYGLFVKDYKGDEDGNIESIVLTSGNELPCSSSTYAQWYATNRNQMNQNIQNILATNAIQSHGAQQQFEIQKDMSSMNLIGGLATALTGLLTYNIGGVGTGLMSAFNTGNVLKSQQATLNTQLALNKQSDQNAIQSAIAQNNDMRNAPPTLVSHGSNVFYGILNNNRKLLLLRMSISEVDKYRIGTYFTMYGYKQNKVMDINLRSRKYFNYFKITAPNIVGTAVPHAQLEKIKDIFKNGVTLWHYENSNKVLDYFHSDNYEV